MAPRASGTVELYMAVHAKQDGIFQYLLDNNWVKNDDHLEFLLHNTKFMGDLMIATGLDVKFERSKRWDYWAWCAERNYRIKAKDKVKHSGNDSEGIPYPTPRGSNQSMLFNEDQAAFGTEIFPGLVKMRDGQDVVIEAGRNVRGAFDFKFDPSTDFASFEAAASAKPFDQAIHDALDQRKLTEADVLCLADFESRRLPSGKIRLTEVHKLYVLMLGAGYESRPDQFARKLSTILYPFQGTQRRAVVLAQATREANGDLEDEGDDENSTELTELDYSDKYVHRNVVFRPYEIIKMATSMEAVADSSKIDWKYIANLLCDTDAPAADTTRAGATRRKPRSVQRYVERNPIEIRNAMKDPDAHFERFFHSVTLEDSDEKAWRWITRSTSNKRSRPADFE